MYVVVWQRPIKSSAMMDVTALEALEAAVLVLWHANDLHDSCCVAGIPLGVSRMKGRYKTMIVALRW
jgi:hypothetical protein